ANAAGSYRNARAQIYTSQQFNGGVGWIPIRVTPTSYSDYGHPVTVQLSAFYQPTRMGSATNFSHITVYNSSGQHDLINTTANYAQQRSYSFTAAPGSVFYVHVNAYSFAQANAMAATVSRLDISM